MSWYVVTYRQVHADRAETRALAFATEEMAQSMADAHRASGHEVLVLQAADIHSALRQAPIPA
jgi:hypothetical protein